VDEEAVEENAAFALSSQSTTIGAVGAAVSASATSVTPVIGPGMSKLAADQFQVVPSRSIPMKVDALMQTLGKGPHVFALDAEWDTHPNKSKKRACCLDSNWLQRQLQCWVCDKSNAVPYKKNIGATSRQS
jgi:hypothetical protein